ncbi:MAG TPA: citramalate synthase [Firmicutes bacterium]|nr:citramalate synthase [Bacillota bacterium]
MAEKIEILDTTLRDGSQRAGISLSVADKLQIAKRLDRFGIDVIEGGWPGSNPKDAEFFHRARQIKWQHARLAAFGSTRRANKAAAADVSLQAIVTSGASIGVLVGKSSAFQVREALRTTLEENLKMIEESIAFLKAAGMQAFFDAEHFFDGYKEDAEYALATLLAAERGGADVIVLCDTNGGTMPDQIYTITKAVVDRLSVKVGIHTHNDCGLGVAGTLLAVDAGARHVQGTVNGYGERAGNADLCQIIANLQLKKGYYCVPDLSGLTDLSRFVDEVANVNPDEYRPFVGSSVFAHKAGLHVSALLRNSGTYEHIDPAVIGNRRRVLISELSGGANLIYKAKEYNIELEKDSAALAQMLQMVKELGHEGYTFEGAEGSFELILRKAVGLYRPYFELIGLRLIIEKRKPGEEPIAEATVKIRVGKQIAHTVSEGNGPVNALDSALRLALQQQYPAISAIHLTDYKVRVLNEQAGTGAKVRVMIESASNGRRWTTVGVSANIIEASWRALVDSIEYGLMICDVKPLTAEPALAQ